MNRFFDKIPLIGKKIPGKITLSFLMLIFAISMQLIFDSFDRIFALLAMFFSFIGDVALNHKRNHKEQSQIDFITGGISFILAHVCYCIAYGSLIKINDYTLINFGFIFAIIIVIGINLLFIKRSRFQNNKKLLWFGITYLWLTGINYVTIFSYAYSVTSIKSVVAIGALMFLSSDVIIGFEKFLGLKSKIARELVWWLYPLGQVILIAIA